VTFHRITPPVRSSAALVQQAKLIGVLFLENTWNRTWSRPPAIGTVNSGVAIGDLAGNRPSDNGSPGRGPVIRCWCESDIIRDHMWAVNVAILAPMSLLQSGYKPHDLVWVLGWTALTPPMKTTLTNGLRPRSGRLGKTHLSRRSTSEGRQPRAVARGGAAFDETPRPGRLFCARLTDARGQRRADRESERDTRSADGAEQ